MANKKIVITDFLTSSPDVESRVLGSGYELHQFCSNDESQLVGKIDDAHALLVWHEICITQASIEILKNCEVIVRCGVGFDNIDVRAAAGKGIPVCNVPDYGTNEVADHTIALLLAVTRGICSFNASLSKSNSRWRWDEAGPLQRITGKTLGIIGLGRIGTAVLLRAKAFGLRVVYYDPYIPDGIDKSLGVTSLSLNDLLECSDIISIHTPLTPKTKGMANKQFFSRVKEGCIILNTARGEIIDFESLEAALKSGKIKAAGLDVLPTEPPVNEPLIEAWRDGKTWMRNKLVLTPHSAFYTEESFVEMRMKAALEAKRVLEGKQPKNCINQDWFDDKLKM